MRILVLSDIHANLDALNAVLAEKPVRVLSTVE
jgi:predicted phosphodiesterase